CTTCIGNSGPLAEPIADAIAAHEMVAVAVLSGNRNFEARIHPYVRANYLASPMLVVAYALVGRIDVDLVTTDHISPAGAIPKDSPAGRWLIEHGVKPVDFNTFGSRRGHHEVMMRGTFGNIRIRNLLAGDREGNWTVHFPSGEMVSIY